MTKLLQETMSEVAKLPDNEQDAIAALILEEFIDERAWDEQFAASQDALSALAAKVRAEIQNGKTQEMGIDEL